MERGSNELSRSIQLDGVIPIIDTFIPKFVPESEAVFRRRCPSKVLKWRKGRMSFRGVYNLIWLRHYLIDFIIVIVVLVVATLVMLLTLFTFHFLIEYQTIFIIMMNSIIVLIIGGILYRNGGGDGGGDDSFTEIEFTVPYRYNSLSKKKRERRGRRICLNNR